MANLKQKVLSSLGIGHDNPWLLRYQSAKRRLLFTDAKLKKDYFQHHTCRKLHLGSSNHFLEGWLNTDLVAAPGLMELDATASYPFEPSSFDFVFSEHMIEHVPYEAALLMLRECNRVLKPGGVIRIVTPDLAKITSIYPQPRDREGDLYLQWMSSAFTPDAKDNHAARVVNAFFRLWGHQFIYDETTLTTTLQNCGFTQIQRCELGHSQHAELQNLEHTQRYPEGLLNYESICLEARKG